MIIIFFQFQHGPNDDMFYRGKYLKFTLFEPANFSWSTSPTNANIIKTEFVGILPWRVVENYTLEFLHDKIKKKYVSEQDKKNRKGAWFRWKRIFPSKLKRL